MKENKTPAATLSILGPIKKNVPQQIWDLARSKAIFGAVSTVANGLEWNHGVEWSGVDFGGVRWSRWIDGMHCSGVGWNGSMECNAVEWNGMESMDAPDG